MFTGNSDLTVASPASGGKGAPVRLAIAVGACLALLGGMYYRHRRSEASFQELGAALRFVAGEEVNRYLPLLGAFRDELHAQFYWAFAITALVALALCIYVIRSSREERTLLVALQTEQKRLRALGDNLPNAYVYRYEIKDGATRYLYVSAGFEQIHGVTVADALADPAIVRKQVADESIPALVAAEERSHRTLSDFEVEIQIHSLNGGRRWLLLRSRPQRTPQGIVYDGIVADLTPLRTAELQSRRRDAWLHSMSAMAHVGAWEFDVHSGAGVWTDEVARIHGVTPEEAPNREKGLAFYPSPYRERIAAAIQDAIQRVRGYDLELLLVTHNGEQKWVRTIGMPVVEGGRVTRLQGTFQDITDRKLAEIELRTANQRLRELTDVIDDVFWITDPQKQKMLYVSPAFEKIWGRQVDQLYADPRVWLDAIHAEDRERIRKAAQEEQSAGKYNHQYRIVRPDGGVRWIHDRAFAVVGGDSAVARIVGVARDITEQKLLEDQFRQSQKMEAIGQLAGGVAHDFNNILAVLMLQTEVLQRDPNLSAHSGKKLATMYEYVERAANLTRQLLVFSRREMMQMQRIDLNLVVADLSRMLRRIIEENVELRLNIPDDPCLIHANRGMIGQVLMNLAVNARDAMPEGGCIDIETRQIQLDDSAAQIMPEAVAGEYAVLSVSDSGSGIDPEILSRIYEPFFTTKQADRGTGLGLSTVFGIVKQHGGWLKVYSELGKGTNFQVFLPRVQSTSAQAAAESAIEAAPGGVETILYVEDETAVRGLVLEMLERHGYKVIAAEDGEDALLQWGALQESVKLLITDVVMPGGWSGQRLAQRLREERPDLPVIYTSGYSATAAGAASSENASDPFVQKPFGMREFLSVVRRTLDGD